MRAARQLLRYRFQKHQTYDDEVYICSWLKALSKLDSHVIEGGMLHHHVVYLSSKSPAW